jgi:hypothetical protein
MTDVAQRRPAGRPGGISLGRALSVVPGIVNDELRRIVAIIEVSVVAALTGPSGRQLDGAFIYDLDNDGRVLARSIRVRFGAPHLAFVALLEVGHFLDACAFPGIGFSSEIDASLAAWRRTVVASHAWRRLNRLASLSAGDPALRAASLLHPAEPWARSYAQFVTVRSHSQVLCEALDALRRATPGAVYLPGCWEDDDFVGLEVAIDDLFVTAGWIVR